MDSNPSIGILGAGISGLSVAYSLKKQGFKVAVYEKADNVGGVLQTYKTADWLVEKGPNTVLLRHQRIRDMLDDLGLSGHILTPGDKTQKRYIVRRKKPVPVPASFIEFLKTDLLSASAKWRLLKEPFVSKKPGDDESIADFINRRLGSEPLEYGINPFISGIYAGDPKELSMRHTLSSLFEMEQKHGSLTKGLFKQKKPKGKTKKALISFDDGLQLLPQRIHQYLGDAVHLNSRILSIAAAAEGWNVVLKQDSKRVEQHHQIIISTLPAHKLGHIWDHDTSMQDIEHLSNIDYVPMSVLGLGFKRSQVQHPLDGFGMLIPEKEPFSLLGCLFSSSLFPQCAPENHVLLTCFVGGARAPKLAAQSTESLLAEVMPQLHTLLGVKGSPAFQHHSFWQHAIPQYKVGYSTFLKSMQQIEKENPGFFMAGNYRGGVSVPDCMLNGIETAKKVQQCLDRV